MLLSFDFGARGQGSDFHFPIVVDDRRPTPTSAETETRRKTLGKTETRSFLFKNLKPPEKVRSSEYLIS